MSLLLTSVHRTTYWQALAETTRWRFVSNSFFDTSVVAGLWRCNFYRALSEVVVRLWAELTIYMHGCMYKCSRIKLTMRFEGQRSIQLFCLYTSCSNVVHFYLVLYNVAYTTCPLGKSSPGERLHYQELMIRISNERWLQRLLDGFRHKFEPGYKIGTSINQTCFTLEEELWSDFPRRA